MGHSFPKSQRLVKQSEFKSVMRNKSRFAGRFCIIDYCIQTNSQNQPRIGIAVSRHFGRAHSRNRYKRVIREAFRHLKDEFPERMDLIVRPRTKGKEASPIDLIGDFKNLILSLRRGGIAR